MRNALTVLTILLFLVSCASPQKSLEKKEYNKAYKSALKALKQNKSIEKNKEILRIALTEIIAEKSIEKDDLKNSEDLSKQEKSIKVNQEIQEKIEKAEPYLGNEFEEKYTELKKEEELVKSTLAQSYFNKGQDNLEVALNSGIKKYAQNSYFDFIKSENFGIQEASLDSLKRKSFDFAQVIYYVDANAPFEITYNWEIDRALDDLEDNGDQFHQIYYERGTGGKKIDCNIDITFGGLDIDLDEDNETLDFSKSVVVGTTTEVVDSVEVEVEVYEDVVAEVSIKTVKKTASWEVSISVSSNTQNCDIGEDSFEESLQFSTREISWNGDERAVPEEYLNFDNEEVIEDSAIAEQLLSTLVENIFGHF